ncbi:NAD(P)-dependent oxidoreductase [Streptacidiphilus pinicola]|uniref:NAD(P)-dependent oxidoreductase n=1 Tax=Streptacidiphilus pinicola TaxID=2219663 RepID=A0A2X0KJ17_9ACTN|nr:NAD(P)-dependent oxidoreductase [Streptacidiphilus pinicola]RAG86999.1 NAD(P)-dependent oxidoreductase [Streptacidiphilus pinicola]
MSRILITGAAGGVGTLLRPRLARPDRTLRLLDIAELEPREGEEVLRASVTDLDAMTKACADVDAVVHLGGISVEAAWADILDVNIHGTRTVFEAARRAGVPRVVFASSNHAVGFHTPDEYPLGADTPPLPDTYYGVSKVAGEALGALYHHRYGLDVICIRILTCFPTPPNPRALSTWLSPDDCARLLEACLAAPSPGYRIVHGVSRNTRGGWVTLDEAAALGYDPQDDAEVHAAAVLAEHGDPGPDDPVFAHLGGPFTFPEFDVDRMDRTETGGAGDE